MKELKWINTKIGVGSIMKEKFDEMEKNTRGGGVSRTRKKIVGCVYAVEGKNKF